MFCFCFLLKIHCTFLFLHNVIVLLTKLSKLIIISFHFLNVFFSIIKNEFTHAHRKKIVLISLEVAVRVVSRGMVGRIVVRTLAWPSAGHHCGRRMTVHAHVAHGGWIGAGVAGRAGAVRLVDHRLHNSPARVDEPVVDLQYAEARVLRQLFLLVLAGVRVGQVLEQPRPQNVRCNFREDSALFGVFILARGVVVIAARAVGGAYARVGRVAGLRQVVPRRVVHGEAGSPAARVLAGATGLVQVTVVVVPRQRGGRGAQFSLKKKN